MTRAERLRFIDEELKGLWPQWTPTDAELCVWMSDLAPLPYDVARAAARACFREQTLNYQRPVLRRFLDKARTLLRSTTGVCSETRDVQTRVFLECLNAPPHQPNLAGRRTGVYVLPTSRQDDLDYVRACAEPMRKRFEQLYGGHWIIITENPKTLSESTTDHESPADQARATILAGPDTPTRRWLQTHLA
jgi:hypothetical protein